MNKQKIRNLRLMSMGVITLLVVIGGAAGAGTGTLSSFGWKTIHIVCPLGYLETALAGRDFIPGLLICFLIITGLTILMGRFFCGWICPVPLVRKLFTNKVDESNDVFPKKKNKDDYENHVNQNTALNEAVLQRNQDLKTANVSFSQECPKPEKKASLGLPILGAALASSAVFSFPVFCLICPIGLVFGTLFALMRLLRFNEPTIDLLIFPIVVFVELVLLKKWCSKFCPLGALLSLFSRFNRWLVPTADRSRCLEETEGIQCRQCRKSCSLDIDIKDGSGTGHISSCIKCKECAISCPAHAISFPWKKKKDDTLREKN